MPVHSMFQPPQGDPNASISAAPGILSGASIGAMFGPVGAIVGGALGILGSLGSSGKRERARRLATESSYEFGKELYAYGDQNRTNINTKYDQDLSTLTARLGASGSTSQSSLDFASGKLIVDRDKDLELLNEELETFRAGPNYEWLRNDYNVVTQSRATYSGGVQRGEGGETTFTIGSVSGGRTGQNAYSESQRKRLKTSTVSGMGEATGRLFNQYGAMIAPSMEMYESRVFGDAEDRKAYDEYIDERITAGNEWFDKEAERLRVTQANRAAFEDNQSRGRQ